jgi:hypothetical protein
VDDLDGVAARDLVGSVSCARDDLAVDLDGDRALAEAEVEDEVSDREVVGHVARSAVDGHVHGPALWGSTR